MSRILALDTASEACSAALWLDGELLHRYEFAPRRHNELLLPMVESLLAEGGVTLTGLDAVAFGRGPGSFTGLRISAGIAHGLAFGADLPLIPVSTLASLAMQAFDRHPGEHALAMLDARMGELYWGLYRRAEEDVVLLGEERVSVAADLSLAEPCDALLGPGPGWAVADDLPEAIRRTVVWSDSSLQPDAAAMARLAVQALARGEAVGPEDAQPVYLRDKVALKESERS